MMMMMMMKHVYCVDEKREYDSRPLDSLYLGPIFGPIPNVKKLPFFPKLSLFFPI